MLMKIVMNIFLYFVGYIYLKDDLLCFVKNIVIKIFDILSVVICE